MPIRSFTPILLVLAIGFLSGIASATPGLNHQVAISLHITDPVAKNTCDLLINPVTVTSQQPALAQPEVGPYNFVYLFACWGSDSVGIGGIECGIDYQGGYAGGGAFPINVFAWTACSDLEFPSAGWPGPNTGNLMTWTRSNCHHPSSPPDVPRSEVALAGYFYMAAYGSGQLSVIPRPVSGRLKVADCFGYEDDLTHFPGDPRLYRAGIAGFGTQPGFNSCYQVVPTTPVTWSRLKSMSTRTNP
jgi:hypothetical protein